MKSGIPIVSIVLLLGGYAAPALALQTLCTSSPENPTAVLGLLGAGVAGYPYLRARAKAWFSRRRGRDIRSD